MELVWNGIKELVESGWSAVMVMKKSKNGSCDSDTWITARCEKEEDNGMYEDLRAVIPRKLQTAEVFRQSGTVGHGDHDGTHSEYVQEIGKCPFSISIATRLHARQTASPSRYSSWRSPDTPLAYPPTGVFSARLA